MDRFRTTLSIQPATYSIGHSERLMLLGSCFTEHIGARLQAGKFSLRINPFGIAYNPVSIARCLERLLERTRPFSEDELFEHGGLWRSWDHHGSFAAPQRDEALRNINEAYHADAAFLPATNRILLTFGTADVFYLRDSGRIVANNHKMPADTFEQRRLSIEEIVGATANALEKIKAGQPDLQVVLTVSPVRHLRAGAIANQRSKATLILACEALCRQFSWVQYFPAYELLLDDLRDYRFYNDDMVHPSEMATTYIWERFMDTCFQKSTKQIVERLDKLRQALQHRPLHPGSDAHRAFVQAQLDHISQLEKEYPALDFRKERTHFEQQRG